MDAGSRWDAICVGAGITSLAFGAQVVKRHPGARILVIDKHGVPGGYATVFQRPKAGAAFDCSLHKLSGMGEGGTIGAPAAIANAVADALSPLGIEVSILPMTPERIFRLMEQARVKSRGKTDE